MHNTEDTDLLASQKYAKTPALVIKQTRADVLMSDGQP